MKLGPSEFTLLTWVGMRVPEFGAVYANDLWPYVAVGLLERPHGGTLHNRTMLPHKVVFVQPGPLKRIL